MTSREKCGTCSGEVEGDQCQTYPANPARVPCSQCGVTACQHASDPDNLEGCEWV